MKEIEWEEEEEKKFRAETIFVAKVIGGDICV